MYSPLGPGFKAAFCSFSFLPDSGFFSLVSFSQRTLYVMSLISAVSIFKDRDGSNAYPLSFLNGGVRIMILLLDALTQSAFGKSCSPKVGTSKQRNRFGLECY